MVQNEQWKRRWRRSSKGGREVTTEGYDQGQKGRGCVQEELNSRSHLVAEHDCLKDMGHKRVGDGWQAEYWGT